LTMNAMNAMTKQKTETEKPGDAAHYDELEELQLESVAAGGTETGNPIGGGGR